MDSRRRFLFRTASLGAGLAVGLPTRADPGADALPDPAGEYGNHLTLEAQRAVERGLAFLANATGRSATPPSTRGTSPSRAWPAWR